MYLSKILWIGPGQSFLAKVQIIYLSHFQCIFNDPAFLVGINPNVYEWILVIFFHVNKDWLKEK